MRPRGRRRRVLCLCPIAVVALALGSPAPAPAGASATSELPSGGTAPLSSVPPSRRPASTTGLPVDGASPLRTRVESPWSEPASSWTGPFSTPLDRPAADPPPGTVSPPNRGVAPLREVRHAADAPTTAGSVATPLGREPAPIPARPSRWPELVRIELLVGPVWRIRATEAMSLVGLEVGRLRGLAASLQGGVIVAPDRDTIAATDFPLGAGVVYRRRFGERALYGSVGLTAGILVHRAATERGVLHRVDPDLQLPLRFTWTVGEVGLSVAVLQGFSFRTRTYSRRGAEVWHRIPYRIGFAVGIHFDIGVGRTRPRRSRGP